MSNIHLIRLIELNKFCQNALVISASP